MIKPISTKIITKYEIFSKFPNEIFENIQNHSRDFYKGLTGFLEKNTSDSFVSKEKLSDFYHAYFPGNRIKICKLKKDIDASAFYYGKGDNSHLDFRFTNKTPAKAASLPLNQDTMGDIVHESTHLIEDLLYGPDTILSEAANIAIKRNLTTGEKGKHYNKLLDQFNAFCDELIELPVRQKGETLDKEIVKNNFIELLNKRFDELKLSIEEKILFLQNSFIKQFAEKNAYTAEHMNSALSFTEKIKRTAYIHNRYGFDEKMKGLQEEVTRLQSKMNA